MRLQRITKVFTNLYRSNLTIFENSNKLKGLTIKIERFSSTQTTNCSFYNSGEDFVAIPKKKDSPVGSKHYKWSEVWKNIVKMKGHTKLGVIRLDYDYPASPGEIDHHETFDCDVIYRVVPGFTFEMCKSGNLTKDVREEFIEAVIWLQDRNVSAITGDCGFMMYYQKLAREFSSTPVFMSSLAQLPAVTCAFQESSQICIFTANLTSLRPMKDVILETIGSDANVENKLIMVGCENVAGFEAVDRGEKVDGDIVMPGIVELAKNSLRENPGIKAFLFECTQLPPFADAVREATGVPVYDAVTCCNFFASGFQENKNFGKVNWKQPWSGRRKEYKFGQELPEEKRRKLVSKKEAEYFC